MRKLPQYGRMTGCSFYATIYSRINIGTLLRNKAFNLKTTKCIFRCELVRLILMIFRRKQIVHHK